jgi:hypothetical protein
MSSCVVSIRHRLDGFGHATAAGDIPIRSATNVVVRDRRHRRNLKNI